MKKLDLLKNLILVMCVLFSTQEAFSQASTVQMLRSSVQPAVAIEKIVVSNSGTINPVTGAIAESLGSSFNIQVNDGKSYEFYVYSTILTSDGSVSAFDKKGNLLFANTTVLPLNSAVANAKQNVAGNADVIVYPFELNVDANMAYTFMSTTAYNECYKVNFINAIAEGELTQTIGNTPVPGTYSVGEDSSGRYSATVYISAIAK